jgi:hypothetical protein
VVRAGTDSERVDVAELGRPATSLKPVPRRATTYPGGWSYPVASGASATALMRSSVACMLFLLVRPRDLLAIFP